MPRKRKDYLHTHCEKCKIDTQNKGCPVTPCGYYLKPYIESPFGVLKVIETWQLVVPLQDDKGNPLEEWSINLVKNDVVRAFRGDTEVRTVGHWIEEQRVYVDKSIRVEIDVSVKNHDKAVKYMVSQKKLLKKILKQKSIYVTLSVNRFELLLVDDFLKELGLELTSDETETIDRVGIDACLERSRLNKRSARTRRSVATTKI